MAHRPGAPVHRPNLADEEPRDRRLRDRVVLRLVEERVDGLDLPAGLGPAAVHRCGRGGGAGGGARPCERPVHLFRVLVLAAVGHGHVEFDVRWQHEGLGHVLGAMLRRLAGDQVAQLVMELRDRIAA